MADDTYSTLVDIKEFFVGCFSNASINSAAKRKFIKYIEAIEEAKNSLMDGDALAKDNNVPNNGWISVKESEKENKDGKVP